MTSISISELPGTPAAAVVVRTGGGIAPVVGAIDRVHAVIVLEVGEEDADLQAFLQRGTGIFQVLLDLVQHALGVDPRCRPPCDSRRPTGTACCRRRRRARTSAGWPAADWAPDRASAFPSWAGPRRFCAASATPAAAAAAALALFFKRPRRDPFSMKLPLLFWRSLTPLFTGGQWPNSSAYSRSLISC